VIGREPHAERVKHTLHGAYRARWAADVFEQHQPPARTQDPMRLGNSPTVIRDRAEAERDDHRVEAPVVELEGLRIADPQVDVSPHPLGPPLAYLQHLWAELDSGHANAGGVVGQIPPGSERKLEDVTLDL
jgi:hypothetical protein